MNLSKPDLQGIILEFDSGIIPPPYSHVFRLLIDWSEGLKATLNIHYTEREDLSEEEILEEGFTLTDDFHFEGEIHAVWKNPIETLLKDTRFASGVKGTGEITLATKEKNTISPPKTPLNQEAWKLLAQDVIQAIYETAKKEAPLQINFCIVDSTVAYEGSITLFFETRNVLFVWKGTSKTLNWEYAFQLMKLIFMPDYDYDIAGNHPGKTPGIYLECGDGWWHELGKGVLNIDQDFDAVQQIEHHLRNLTETD